MKKGISVNINPDKVKELVLIFSELDEDYQKQLLIEAYKLQLMQGQKNQLQKEGITFTTKEEFQEEIEKKTNKRTKEIIDLMQVIDKMNDTNKAAMFMAINQLVGKPNMVQESDITITVTHKDISMKEYLEKHLVNVDYEKAKKVANRHMNEMKIMRLCNG